MKFLKNKQVSLILVIMIFYIILVYTHSNTYLANDDLPYMFLYRTDIRVASILDAIKNQCADYFNINGRIFVHTILQCVLIFDKKLWIMINPIMIIFSLLFIMKIIELENKNINKVLSFLLGISLFLSLIKYKQIIYWVAGSINYIWIFLFLLVVLYFYYKNGFHKNKYVNTIIIFILCMIHECTMVFTIVFVLGNMIVDWYKNKKFNKKYLIYALGFLGSFVLLLSPANQNRLVSDEVWNQLNLIEKLMTSIPVISKNLLNITNYKTLISYCFIFSVVSLMLENKDKLSKLNIILIIINMLLIYILKNDWLYFTLVLLLAIGENYTYLKRKEYHGIVLSLSMYAVVYFNIVSPTYAAGRPNYYFYMYIILLTMKQLNHYITEKGINTKPLFCVICIVAITLLSNEIYVYTKFGNYHNQRLNQINEFMNQKDGDILYLTKIPYKYADYHMDINLPNKNWFTYRYFIQYYHLPQDIEIIYQ